MEILPESSPEGKLEFEPIDHMIIRAHDAIKRFAGERSFEYLHIVQQFELDLAEAESICRPEVQRKVCEAYIWLGKGV